MSAFMDWVIDTLASEDIIDLYFIVSDLVDIPISEAERAETAFYDSMATATVNAHQGESGIPLGKLVL